MKVTVIAAFNSRVVKCMKSFLWRRLIGCEVMMNATSDKIQDKIIDKIKLFF